MKEMSYKEQLVQLAHDVPDNLAMAIFTMLKNNLMILEEVQDQAFCLALDETYEKSLDKGDPISLEEYAAQLGVVLE